MESIEFDSDWGNIRFEPYGDSERKTLFVVQHGPRGGSGSTGKLQPVDALALSVYLKEWALAELGGR